MNIHYYKKVKVKNIIFFDGGYVYFMVNCGNFNVVGILEFKKLDCTFGIEPKLCYLFPRKLQNLY